MDYSRDKGRALTLYRNQSVVSIPSCYFLPRYCVCGGEVRVRERDGVCRVGVVGVGVFDV